ncbi:MAG: hypothetical protein Q7S73_01790 [bacterium]|nr:hypothetical protein [bacterium]
MRRFESKGGESTGHLVEWQHIGKVDSENSKYQKALKEAQIEEAKKTGKSGEYMRFRTAMELARQFSPYDPTNPDKPFARDIRIAFQDLLESAGALKEEDRDLVRFFTAVGTPLDKFHGVDGWLEYLDPKDRKRYFATFDFTKNPNKQVYKSDIMVMEQDLPDRTLETKNYLEKIEEYAKEALKKIVARQVQEQKIVLDRQIK